MIKRLRNNRKGFTLMELIIVMVVIGILVALAVPKFGQFRDKAEIVKIQNDLKVVENLTALELMNTKKTVTDFDATLAGQAINKHGEKVDVAAVKLIKVQDLTDPVGEVLDNAGTGLDKDKFYTTRGGYIVYEVETGTDLPLKDQITITE